MNGPTPRIDSYKVDRQLDKVKVTFGSVPHMRIVLEAEFQLKEKYDAYAMDSVILTGAPTQSSVISNLLEISPSIRLFNYLNTLRPIHTPLVAFLTKHVHKYQLHKVEFSYGSIEMRLWACEEMKMWINGKITEEVVKKVTEKLHPHVKIVKIESNEELPRITKLFIKKQMKNEKRDFDFKVENGKILSMNRV